jgi:hypothetical protein
LQEFVSSTYSSDLLARESLTYTHVIGRAPGGRESWVGQVTFWLPADFTVQGEYWICTLCTVLATGLALTSYSLKGAH